MPGTPKRYLFVTYARQDVNRVTPVVDILREELRQRHLDVDVWIDLDNLMPGQVWEAQINRALQESIGLLVFVSSASMASRWVRQELEAVSRNSLLLIIPVILEHVSDLPSSLSKVQWIDLSENYSGYQGNLVASQIADAIEFQGMFSGMPLRPVSAAEAPAIASQIAQETRSAGSEAVDLKGPDSVFVVHGHDGDALSEMEDFLAAVGVKPVVLSKIGGPNQSLLQKFLKTATEARFAIVILSADDRGASRKQYEAPGVGVHALQFRARQNVVLELGFFYGRLGWEKVFVLQRPAPLVFPNFERPSDIDGAVFDEMDPQGRWRQTLSRKLIEAGFRIAESN